MLFIMPKIPEISVGIQMERSVSVSSDRNIRDHLIDLLLFATKKSHFVFDGDYVLRSHRWCRYGVSTWSSISEHFHV